MIKPTEMTPDGQREFKSCYICEHHNRCRRFAISGRSRAACVAVANTCSLYLFDELYCKALERYL